jgi:hypothetical protein
VPSFQLFRLKVFMPGQTSFLQADESPSELIRRIVGEKPSAPLRGRMVWHIGNVIELDADAAYCRFGKMTRDALPVLDPETGDFIERDFATAPYTHIVLDFPNEVCGIAAHNQLAPETHTIARQFAKVMQNSNAARAAAADVSIDEVRDPDDFIEHLRSAFAIKKFSLSLTRPNPFDANEQFQKPFERFVKAAHGETGRTEVKGASLDSEVLQDLARAAGATGNYASA